MVWQKIDDQFGVSKKVVRIPRRRRQQCVGLWVLALNYAGRSLTDGILDSAELDDLDARSTDVAELVRVELWHTAGHDCDRCEQPVPGAVVIHDFLIYNPSKEKVLADREAERVRKMSQRDKRRTPGSVPDVSEHPVPDPVPRLTDMTNVPESSLEILARAAELGINDLPKVQALLSRTVNGAMTLKGAYFLARHIIGNSKMPVDRPYAYLETACRRPDEVCDLFDELDIAGVA